MFGVLLLVAAQDGPLSKFEKIEPNLQTTSAKAISDVERCLIDLPGKRLPFVYRQEDRPGQTTIIWTLQGEGQAVIRADLKRVATGTEVKGWRLPDSTKRCF